MEQEKANAKANGQQQQEKHGKNEHRKSFQVSCRLFFLFVFFLFLFLFFVLIFFVIFVVNSERQFKRIKVNGQQQQQQEQKKNHATNRKAFLLHESFHISSCQHSRSQLNRTSTGGVA